MSIFNNHERHLRQQRAYMYGNLMSMRNEYLRRLYNECYPDEQICSIDFQDNVPDFCPTLDIEFYDEESGGTRDVRMERASIADRIMEVML